MTKERGDKDMSTTQISGIPGTIPEGWHSVSQAAALVGRSADTLRRWDDDGIFHPSGEMKSGELRVRLYNDEDIVKMKAIVKTLRPGRPRNED